MVKIILIFIILCTFGCNTHGDSNKTIIPEDNSRLETKSNQPPSDTITICSFNIQFLGNFKKKDDEALAYILQDYDIVVVQELVAPPFEGSYPDGSTYTSDAESLEFFNAMQDIGFQYILSEEDTGPGEVIHKSTTATEWWTCFYKPDKIDIATDLPQGFLSDDRSANSQFERVPYAFAFRKDALDFVLISVHLNPGSSQSDANRREEELSGIKKWIDENDDFEKDFIILGDMNIEDADELNKVTPEGYVSLNDECRKTNTASGSDKPYDHVMYNISNTEHEIDTNFDLQVVDLIEIMKEKWTDDDPYPGDPYNHNIFRQYYSDHYPVVFKMINHGEDDDG